MTEIKVATTGELELVQALYQVSGYQGVVDKNDLVLIACCGHEPVGAVRLCKEHHVTVLRGMQVRSGFQRKGIGKNLLDACMPYLDHELAFCLPYAHLISFYERAGFKAAACEEVPQFLGKRLADYLSCGQNVIAMCRQPNVNIAQEAYART